MAATPGVTPARAATVGARTADVPAPAVAPSTQRDANAVAGVGSAHAPIPYKHEGGGLAASATGAMVVAALLLGGLYIALRFARQRGLLDRWIVAAPRADADAAEPAPLRVERVLRVSPKTSVYRIRDGARRYLLVESLAQATLVPLPEDAPQPTPDDDVPDARS